MTLSVLATLLLVLAALGALFIGLGTGFYTAKVPSGPDSMSLATPMIALIALWVLTLVGAWLCVARGGLDWVSGHAMVPFAVATLGTIGLGLASGGTFVLWSQSGLRWAAPLAVLGTVLLPLAAQALLLVCAWTAPADLAAATWPRVTLFALAPCALAGLGLGGWLFVANEQRKSRLVEERLAREAEIASDRADQRPRAEKIGSALAQLEAAAPFASIVARLPEDDAQASGAIVARAEQAPDRAAGLDAALRSGDAALRIGAAEFVRLCSSPEGGCADALAAAIRSSAVAIRRVGMMSGLEGEDFERWTVVLAGAARRVSGPELAPALAELRATIASTSDEPQRSQALAALDAR